MDRLSYSKSASFGIMLVLCICIVSIMASLAPSGTKTKIQQASLAAPRPTTAPGSSDPTGDEWPMLGRQLNHTSVATTTPVQGSGSTWNYTTGNQVGSSPAVSGGCVYVGSYDHNVYCLNATTGTKIWNYTTGMSVGSTPAVAGGGWLYVGSNDHKVYALGSVSGAYTWSYTTGGQVLSSPAVWNGRVYVGSLDHNIYCLNAFSGAKIWNYSTGNTVWSSPAVVGGRVYVGSTDDKIYCLDATTGALIWWDNVYSQVQFAPAVSGGCVYIGNNNGEIYCLNATNGGQIWYYNSGGGNIVSSPAVASGHVYIGGWDHKIYCLNAATGLFIWSYATNGNIYSTPAVAGGYIYVGSYDHDLYCLNATTGAFIWSYTMGGYVYSPAVAAGHVYVGSQDHNVCCLPMIMTPTAPETLLATPGVGKVTLAWQAPAVTHASPLLYYKIYRGTSPGYEFYYMTTRNGTTTAFTDYDITVGKNYYYTVSAVTVAGEGAQSNEASAKPGDVPGVPQNLRAIAGNGKIMLSWDAPSSNGGSPITDYIIFRGTSPWLESNYKTINCAITFTDTNVVSKQMYYYTIEAVNNMGPGLWSNEANATATSVPGQPRALLATGGNGQVTLSWQPPLDNGGAAITNYMIYRGASAGSEAGYITVGNITSAMDTNVVNGQIYYYTVSAVSAAGEGSQTTETFAIPATVPSIPLNLISTGGNGQVTLTWQSPLDNGGSAITSYYIYRGLIPALLSYYTMIGNVLTFTDTAGVAGETWFYKVSAVNIVGEGLQSNMVSAISITTPSTPRNLMINGGNGQITIRWQSPLDNGGAAITNYMIYRGTSPGSEAWYTTTANVTSFTDTSLVNGQVYYYNVSALTCAGEGTPSNELDATPMTLPGTPQNVVATPGNGQVTLTWQAPANNGGSEIWNYNIFRGMSSGGESYVTTLGHIFAWTDTGLVNGQIYYYMVDAINFAGEGEQAEEVAVTPATVPIAPRSFTAIGENGYILLTWDYPLNDGGSAITNYKIYRSTTPGNELLYMTIGDVTSCADTSNLNGQLYYYTACAVNSAGDGAPSREASALPAISAGSPQDLVATPGIGQITLTWQAPVSNGGSAIMNYRVYRGTSSGGESLVTTLGNVLTWSDTGRTSGQIYYYTVSPINVAGEGPKTNEANATPPTMPGVPRNLVATGENGQVTLAWQVPAVNGGGAITNYMIYRGTSTGSEAWFMTIGNVTSFTDTSVVNGQTYYYTVIAMNGAGAGAQASEASASVPATSSTPSTASGLSTADDTVIAITIIACIGVVIVAFLIDFRSKKLLATMARNFEQGPSKIKGKKGGSRYTGDTVSGELSTSNPSDDLEPSS
ncbi:MAG TPA: PQQ-binding-like beta-propeller repeat protein [Candidatus Lokiarchaeia archaeon]|nr:PQQ-binding-like beta-propeller repeat protein [Candidatus Lokiarchaeia archaeon]